MAILRELATFLDDEDYLFKVKFDFSFYESITYFILCLGRGGKIYFGGGGLGIYEGELGMKGTGKLLFGLLKNMSSLSFFFFLIFRGSGHF